MFPHRQYDNGRISAVGDGVKFPSIDPITGGEFVRAEEGSSLALALSATVLCNLKDQISEACILTGGYCVAVVHRW